MTGLPTVPGRDFNPGPLSLKAGPLSVEAGPLSVEAIVGQIMGLCCHTTLLVGHVMALKEQNQIFESYV